MINSKKMKKEEKTKEVLSFQNDFIRINDIKNKKIPEEKGCYIIRILEKVKINSNYRFEENSLSNRIIYVGLGGEDGTKATIKSRFSKHIQDSGTPTSSFRRSISAVLMEEKQLNPFLNNSDKIDHNNEERTIITVFIKQNCECRFITLKDNKNFNTAEKLEEHLVELLKPTLNCKNYHDKENNEYYKDIRKLRKKQYSIALKNKVILKV